MSRPLADSKIKRTTDGFADWVLPTDGRAHEYRVSFIEDDGSETIVFRMNGWADWAFSHHELRGQLDVSLRGEVLPRKETK